MSSSREPSSFRDPSGFVFRRDGQLFRQINRAGRDNYDLLMKSGLYDNLIEQRLLVPHRELDVEPFEPDAADGIISPETIPFVSYPYEWPYSMLWHAARLTIEIQRRALQFGMSLKDATAYNVQFRGTRPVWIDTLSFERYREGNPWVAYRQFCEHYLAPLALMRHGGLGLGVLARCFLDGVPLPHASRLLPLRTRLQLGLLIHVHLHARSMNRLDAAPPHARRGSLRFDARAMGGLIDSLASALAHLAPPPVMSHWSRYYRDNSYSEQADHAKQEIVEEFLARLDPETVWDLGSNTGRYSAMAARDGRQVVAMDADSASIESLFQRCADAEENNVLPLVIDLSNPSPDLGWACNERSSLLRRGPADLGLALALVHHLAIGNNVSLEQIARLFARLCRSLVIEFVPKEDPQVKRMLATRDDVFPHYDQASFEKAFSHCFEFHEVRAIPESPRILYLLSARAS